MVTLLLVFVSLLSLLFCGRVQSGLERHEEKSEMTWRRGRSENVRKAVKVDAAKSIFQLEVDLYPFPEPAPFEHYGKHKRVVILHIPKTAGMSFINEVDKAKVFKSGLPQSEYCFDLMLHKFGPLNSSYTVAFYRAPRSHMYSQFLECKYDWWGVMKTNGTSFPRRYSNPVGFEKWIDWFYDSWNGHMSTSTNITTEYYNCYHPYNMQTRFMSQPCRAPPYKYLGPLTNHHLQLAIQRVNSLPFIGLTEYFDVSMCLFWYYFGQLVPFKKNCVVQGDFVEIKRQQAHETHGVPKHSEYDISESVWKRVDGLTQFDTILYRFATMRFFENVRLFELQTNVSLQHLMPFNAQFLLSVSRFE